MRALAVRTHRRSIGATVRSTGIPVPSGFLRVGVGGATSASTKYQPPSQCGRRRQGDAVESAPTDDEWLSIDLGATYEIARVDVLWEKAHAAAYDLEFVMTGAPVTPVTRASRAPPMPVPW